MRDQAPEPPDGRSQRERMLAGELYVADDPQLAADSLRALTLTREFNASDPADTARLLASIAGDKYSYREMDNFTDVIERQLKLIPLVSKVERAGVLDERVYLT